MTRKHAPVQSTLPERDTPPAPMKTEPRQEHDAPPAPMKTEKHHEHEAPPAAPKTEPHHDVSSPAVVHANDKMKLGAKPNDAEPLAHRDRAKAGHKG